MNPTQQCMAFVQAHTADVLETMCKELLERQETGILVEGAIRDLAEYMMDNMVITLSDAISVIENTVYTLAMRRVVA